MKHLILQLFHSAVRLFLCPKESNLQTFPKEARKVRKDLNCSCSQVNLSESKTHRVYKPYRDPGSPSENWFHGT